MLFVSVIQNSAMKMVSTFPKYHNFAVNFFIFSLRLKMVLILEVSTLFLWQFFEMLPPIEWKRLKQDWVTFISQLPSIITLVVDLIQYFGKYFLFIACM